MGKKNYVRCPALPWGKDCRVKMLQRRLRAFGLYHGKLDGCYGARTREAVVQFQQWVGIPGSGRMTPCTWQALFGAGARLSSQYTAFTRSLCLRTPYMQGLDVWMVQQKLVRQGFLQARVDARYGPDTLSAVRAFQAAMQIEIDGIIGPETWNALF